MKKRLLAALLAATLVLELGEIPAMAQDSILPNDEITMVGDEDSSSVISDTNINSDMIFQSCMWTNPIYGEIDSSYEEKEASNETYIEATGISTYSSSSAATRYLKKQLMERNTKVITFQVKVSTRINSEKAKKMWNDILCNTYKVTTNPQEGDYLRYHVYGLPNDGLNGTSWVQDGNIITFKYHVIYQSTASEENRMKTGIASAVSSLGMTKDSDLQKVKKIHDYICRSVSYDNSMSNHSAYDALYEKSAVCQGYSNLFYAMCIKAGVPVRQITGDSDGNGTSDHIWNIVKLGNKWYNVDATWDSQGSGVYYNFFLKSNANFGIHIRDLEFNTSSFNASYPMTQTSYNGSVENTKITKVSSAGYNTIQIAWNKVATATRYDVYYSTNKNGNWRKAATSGGGVTGIRLTKIQTGVTYYFKVQPVSDIIGDEVLGEFTSTVSGKAVPAKAAVKSLASGSKKMKVTWKKVSGASGYQVFYSYKYQGKTVKKTVHVKGSGTLKKTIGKLPKGVKVSVKVRAYRTVSGKKITGSYSTTKKVRIK